MERVAIFGNAGGGKSTLARQLSTITGLPLHSLDQVRWGAGGVALPYEAYLQAHAEIVRGEAWIVDGYGCIDSTWQRLSMADTLVHVDLPLWTHFVWIAKRFVKGMFVVPEGWPPGSPMLSSTISSYRVLWACHRALTPKYRAYVAQVAGKKRVYHLRSRRDISRFLESVQQRADTQ